MNSVNSAMLFKTDLSIYLYLLCSKMSNEYINLNFFSICQQNCNNLNVILLIYVYTCSKKAEKRILHFCLISRQMCPLKMCEVKFGQKNTFSYKHTLNT